MTPNLQQLKQIIKYSAKRMYFGDWTPETLDNIYFKTSTNLKTDYIYIGDLTEDFICDVLWYEMSYNPARFGTKSPFKTNEKNSLLYFLETYRKWAPRSSDGLIPHEIMDLVWQITDFIKSLGKAKLYDSFIKTGKLPQRLDILCADANYHLLSSLRKTIHAIAKQNYKDLQDPDFQEQMFQVIIKRHPTCKRSDISYMAVKAEAEIQQAIKPIIQEQIHNSSKVVQTCFPFKIRQDALKEIRQDIIQTKNEIALLEQQIEDLSECEGGADTSELKQKLSHAKQRYASLYGQEAKLLKKIESEQAQQNTGR